MIYIVYLEYRLQLDLFFYYVQLLKYIIDEYFRFGKKVVWFCNGFM